MAYITQLSSVLYTRQQWNFHYNIFWPFPRATVSDHVSTSLTVCFSPSTLIIHIPSFMFSVTKKKTLKNPKSNWRKDRSILGKMKAETVTLILVNLAGIMERADESLLPGVYKEVGAALHTDPTGLGSLTLLRSMVQAVCYPLAAYMSMRHNRAHVIALDAFLWSAATFLVAFSSTFFQVLSFCLIHCVWA